MRLSIPPGDRQPPLRPELPRSLDALREMLAQGWQIEAPVLARLSWSQQRSGERSYHIILGHAARRSLIVLPASPEIHSFLAEQNIPITETH